MIPKWAHGPFELIESGCENQRRGTDPGRRHALTYFDQSIEVAIRTFGDLHPTIRGVELPRERSDQARGHFPDKVHFLRWFSESSGRPLAVPPEEILWFHTLRNNIYHAGNGFTPEATHVDSARLAALAVFRLLFGDEAGAAAERQLEPRQAEVREAEIAPATSASRQPQRPPAVGPPRKGDLVPPGRVQSTWAGGYLITSDYPRGMYGNRGRRGGPGVGCGCADPAPRMFAPDPAHPDRKEPARYRLVGPIPPDFAGIEAEGEICGRCNRAMASGERTATSPTRYARRSSTLDGLLERGAHLGVSDSIRAFVERATGWGLHVRVHYFCVNLNAPENKSVGLIILAPGTERPGHVRVHVAAKSFARFYPQRSESEYATVLGSATQLLTPSQLDAFADRVEELLARSR